MKTALVVGSFLIALAVVWYVNEAFNQRRLDLQTQQIKALQDIALSQSSEIVATRQLIDLHRTAISDLNDKLRLQKGKLNDYQARIESLNAYNNSLRDELKSESDLIIKNSDTVSALQQQVSQLASENNRPPQVFQDDKSVVYPDDNGFDGQDLGSGFFAYQYFGRTISKPSGNIPEPSEIPNHTPWIFSGNAGIASNNSGFYLANAAGIDSNGAKSTSGQAAFLQYKGSSVSQSMVLAAGTYSVLFDYEARRDYIPNRVSVSIDNQTLFEGTPTDSNNFQHVTSIAIRIQNTGEHKLAFKGLEGTAQGGSDATFIDNVSLRRVGPEITQR